MFFQSLNLQLNKEFEKSCSPDLIMISKCRFLKFFKNCFEATNKQIRLMIFKIFWRLHLELIAKYGEPLTSLEKLKNKTSKSFWSHCGVYIGSGLGGSTCDFWIIAPKGSKHGLRALRKSFFEYQTFGLGRQIWLKLIEAFGAFLDKLSAPILLLWVPCPWSPSFSCFFYKNIPNMILAMKNLGNSHHTSIVGVLHGSI